MNRLVLLCVFMALFICGAFGENSTAPSTMAQSNAMSAIKAGSNANAPDAADANSAIIDSVTYSKTSQSVEIKNNETSALDLTGWKLEVQNKTVYAFPKYLLGVNATVKVHSGLGKNSNTDLYAAATLLTKPEDEVSLLDATGAVISTSEESKEVSDSANDA
jgi:hypothetical protein